MLVLARKAGEKIIIGDGEIKIIALGTDPKTGQMKLGFEAAQEIKINREEIFERIKAGKENKDGKK